jgi:hypothetical protein
MLLNLILNTYGIRRQQHNFNTDPGSAALIIIITKVRYATYGAQGTALCRSPSHKDRSIRRSLPQVQHKDRSIRRARAHLVTARVPTHLHIRGYITVWLATIWLKPVLRIRIRDPVPF